MANDIVETGQMQKYKMHQMLVRIKWLCLFVNDFTPPRGLGARDNASFVEADSPGYARADVSGFAGDPNLYTLDAEGTCVFDIGTFEFTCTADGPPESVYGWWIQADDGEIFCAQRADGPFIPLPFYRAGDKVRVHIRFKQMARSPEPIPAP